MTRCLLALLLLLPAPAFARAAPRAAATVPTLTLWRIVDSGPTRTYSYALSAPPSATGSTLGLVGLAGVRGAAPAPFWRTSFVADYRVEWTLVRTNPFALARYLNVVADRDAPCGVVEVQINGVAVGAVLGPAMVY